MINIIIDNDNGFYRLGFQTLLSKIFLERFGKKTTFTSGIDTLSAAKADVIIMKLAPGESGVCHPALYARRKGSLIIGDYEVVRKPYIDELPLCFENMIFINRNEPITLLTERIVDGWEHCSDKAITASQWQCLACGHKTLSPQQIKVATHYSQGSSAHQIAQSLDINIKTVFAHKRIIMGKFNLNSDCELLRLLNVMNKLKNNVSAIPIMNI